ncbi:MAG TPA: hypothetical protein VGN19_05740 [Pedococcus sp.]|jgi:hypothetical protein|nr:hypothetical protein [Pedococcus sp.]
MSEPADLEQIRAAHQATIDVRADLRAKVAQARANGRSWTEIAMVLRTSRQAARERFGR